MSHNRITRKITCITFNKIIIKITKRRARKKFISYKIYRYCFKGLIPTTPLLWDVWTKKGRITTLLYGLLFSYGIGSDVL